MRKIAKIFLIVLSLCCLIVGCNKQEKQMTSQGKTITVTDSSGTQVEIPCPVRRAVISNAYNAELINAINAMDYVVGVDNYIYNDQRGFGNRFKKEQVVGTSQREINFENVIKLNPEVLILTGNGSVEEARRKLTPFGIKVIVCDAYFTQDFSKNAKLLGQVFGKEKDAEDLVNYFEVKLKYLQKQLKDVKKKRLYFEYRKEGSTTIPGNYFYKMVEFSGADNIFKDAKNVNVDSESIIKRNPQYIVKVSDINVMSKYEPPTLAEHEKILSELKNRPGWDNIDAVKDNKIFLLSHYVHGGASKLVGTMYIAKFLYPELLPDLNPEEVFKVWLEKYQHLSYISGHTYPAYKLD
ncbi:MAG: ABC transporter substrate-binding protein [Phascolarctobacterium sp.]|nr:ABC transporter substrate-binding protein [Phascolarctobacterium sp.]